MTLPFFSARSLIRAADRPFARKLASSLMSASLLSSTAAMAQATPVDAPISEAELAADIRTLAGDAFQGRDPGTAGEVRTIAHIVGSWAASAMVPVSGSDTPWLQSVPLVRVSQLEGSLEFFHEGKPIALAADDLSLRFLRAEHSAKDVDLIFVGHGVDEHGKLPEGIEGKVAVMLADNPPFLKSAPSLLKREQTLSAAGAAAIIVVADEDMPWDQLREVHPALSTTRDTGQPKVPLHAMISMRGFDLLAKALGRESRAMSDAAKSARFRAQLLPIKANFAGKADVKTFESHNVLAKFPGANSDGKAVIVMGHWDGLGICEPKSAEDRICNGAVDNASGIAVMNAVARRLSKGPKMDRDVYFLATSAEEMGLFGAFQFVDHPVVPLDDIIVALNLDTVAIAPRGSPVATVGRGRPAFDAKIKEVVAALGRRLDTDGEADAFVHRQDGWAFGAKDVPALMVGGSFSDMKLLDAYLAGNYHRPKDEFSANMTLGGAAEDGDLHVKLVRAFASRSEWPADQGKVAKPKR